MFVNEYGASYTNKKVGDYSLISGSLGGIRAAESSIGIINSNTLNKQKYCSILITANSIGISVNNNNINDSDDMGISLQNGASNCIVKIIFFQIYQVLIK